MKKWIVDHVHSTIGFEVKHMMVSKVRGQFDSFTADVEADDLTDLTTAKIAFSFEGGSINTRNEESDKRFGGDEFVVMLREVESEDSVIPIVRKLLKEFQVVVKQRHGTMKIM